MVKPILHDTLTVLRSTVQVYMRAGLDFELAVWLIGSHMKALDVPITQRNLETVFAEALR